MMVGEYQGYGGRYHKQPHYQPRKYNHCSRSCCGWTRRHCKAQQQRWKPEELGRQQTRAWTSCHSQWRGARGGENRIRNQFHHRRSGRSRNLGAKSSCPIQLISFVPQIQNSLYVVDVRTKTRRILSKVPSKISLPMV